MIPKKNIKKLSGKNNPGDIYFYRPDLPHVDTSARFEIIQENGNLRVKNKHINCLFSHLTPERFDKLYNDFNQYLNLDFTPLILNNRVYEFTDLEKEKLFDTIVTSWIYYYTVNNLPVKIQRSDFTHPYMVDYLLSVMGKKYGTDSLESLTLGAKILRQDLDIHIETVKGRRQYYDR